MSGFFDEAAKGSIAIEAVDVAGRYPTRCTELESLSIIRNDQPALDDAAEQEIARYGSMIDLFMLVDENDRLLVEPVGSGSIASIVRYGACCLVVTDRRLVGVISGGEILGKMVGQRQPTQILAFSLLYQNIAAVSVDRKTKAFGGVKDTGLSLTSDPLLGMMKFEIIGTTTPDLDGRKMTDHRAVAAQILQTGAAALMALTTGTYRQRLSRLRDGLWEEETAEELVSALAPTSETEAAERDGSATTSDDGEGAGGMPGSPVAPVLAPEARPDDEADTVVRPEASQSTGDPPKPRFCRSCGSAVEPGKQFCTACGSPVGSKSAATAPLQRAAAASPPVTAPPPAAAGTVASGGVASSGAPPQPRAAPDTVSSRGKAPRIAGGLGGLLLLMIIGVVVVSSSGDDESPLTQYEIDAIVDREFAGEAVEYRNCALAGAGTQLASATDEAQVRSILRNSSSSSECRDLADSGSDDEVAAPLPTVDRTSTSTTLTTVRGFADSGILYGNRASLRTRPVVSDDTLIRFVGNEPKDIPIDIHEVGDDGWYEITIQGDRGWVFGTFIQPSADGYDVAETRTGDPATLRDSSGRATSEDNPSINAVLLVDRSGPYWEVVLPDGGSAWVEPAEMDLIG